MNTVVLSIFIAVGLLSYGVLTLFFTEDRVVSRRLKGMTAYEVSEAAEAQPILKPFRERVLSPIAASVGRVAMSIGPRDYRKKVGEQLALAGGPGGLSPEAFIAIKSVFALLLAFLAFSSAVVGRTTPRVATLMIPVALVFGYLAPNLWLRNIREHRQLALRRELPDMLDMLTISVEAGLGFDAALAKYVKNSDTALAVEFARVLQEVQAGVPRRAALRRLSERTDVTELNSFVAAMVQAEVLGTSIATVLRTQAHEMRLRRRQHAEEEAQRLPVKMVFPVIICILPATLIVVLGPAVIALMRFFAS